MRQGIRDARNDVLRRDPEFLAEHPPVANSPRHTDLV